MKWTIESAKACISRNNGTIADKGITILRPGIKVLGAIDYLLKNGFHWTRL